MQLCSTIDATHLLLLSVRESLHKLINTEHLVQQNTCRDTSKLHIFIGSTATHWVNERELSCMNREKPLHMTNIYSSMAHPRNTLPYTPIPLTAGKVSRTSKGSSPPGPSLFCLSSCTACMDNRIHVCTWTIACGYIINYQ